MDWRDFYDDWCQHCGDGIDPDPDEEARACGTCGRWQPRMTTGTRVPVVSEGRCPGCGDFWHFTVLEVIGQPWPRCAKCGLEVELAPVPLLRDDTPLAWSVADEAPDDDDDDDDDQADDADEAADGLH